MEQSRLTAALPFAMSMGGALSGFMTGLVFSVSAHVNTSWSLLLWTPGLIGVGLGLLIGSTFSPYPKVASLQNLKRILTSNVIGFVAGASALGLVVSVIGLIVCAVSGVWQFTWPALWASLGISTLSGGLAGLGAIFMNGTNAR
jgi:hypothetical protein